MTSDVETNIVAVERIKEYAEIEQEANWDIEEVKPPKEWPQTGAIQFKNYGMRCVHPGGNAINALIVIKHKSFYGRYI